MIVDTSALMAILLDEPEQAEFKQRLAEAPDAAITAPTYVELMMVCEGRGSGALRDRARRLVSGLNIRIMPFETDLAEEAVLAFLRFGRGSGHPARLNFGDCLSYAAARLTATTLLFKGEDFTRTDIISAL